MIGVSSRRMNPRNGSARILVVSACAIRRQRMRSWIASGMRLEPPDDDLQGPRGKHRAGEGKQGVASEGFETQTAIAGLLNCAMQVTAKAATVHIFTNMATRSDQLVEYR